MIVVYGLLYMVVQVVIMIAYILFVIIQIYDRSEDRYNGIWYCFVAAMLLFLYLTLSTYFFTEWLFNLNV